MHSIIIGSGTLGLLTHYLIRKKSNQFGNIDVYGRPVQYFTKPFILGENTATNYLFSGRFELKPKVESQKLIIYKTGSMVKGDNRVKPTYKRPKSFTRDNNSRNIYLMNKPTKYGKGMLNQLLENMIDESTNCEVLALRISIKRRSVEITYIKDQVVENDQFQWDERAPVPEIIITLPIRTVKYSNEGNDVTIMFFRPDEIKNQRGRFGSYYHLYEYKVLIKDGEFFTDLIWPYAYVQDEYFVNPYLKRIVFNEIIKQHNLLSFSLQFVSRDILSSLDIVFIGAKIQKLFEQYEPKGTGFRYIGVESRKPTNKKLLKDQQILRTKFNTLLAGRFTMNDHSRLHTNLQLIHDFIKGGEE